MWLASARKSPPNIAPATSPVLCSDLVLIDIYQLTRARISHARLEINIISCARVAATWFLHRYDPHSVLSASITGCWAGSPRSPFTPGTVNYVDGHCLTHIKICFIISIHIYHLDRGHYCKTETQYHLLYMGLHHLILVFWPWLVLECLHHRMQNRLHTQSIHSRNSQLCGQNIIHTLKSIKIYIYIYHLTGTGIIIASL